MVPLWARVDLRAIALKGYSVFPKAPALLEPHNSDGLMSYQDTCWGGGASYLSTEIQSVYSIAPLSSRIVILNS